MEAVVDGPLGFTDGSWVRSCCRLDGLIPLSDALDVALNPVGGNIDMTYWMNVINLSRTSLTSTSFSSIRERIESEEE